VPDFAALTFTGCLIDGKTLAHWQPRDMAVKTESSSRSAVGMLTVAGTSFNTY